MLQSTSLLRGKTAERIRPNVRKNASIHFPLAREDPHEYTLPGRVPMLQSTSLLRGKTPFLPDVEVGHCASIHFPLAREDVHWLASRRICKSASIHFPLAREDRKFHQKTPVFILCSCIFPPYNFLLFLQQIRISVSFVYYFFILTVRIPFRFHVHLWFAPLTSSLYILFH